MTLSDLEEILSDYERAKYSPGRSEVHFGCDCGCGGDSYTMETWDQEEAEAVEAIEAMKKFCQEHNIEYDGIE